MASDYRQISIDEFKRITQFDLSQYMIRVDYFFNNNYTNIHNWYAGETNKPDTNSFKLLNRLIYESDNISNLVTQNKNRFDKAYFWDLLENLEDLKEQLITTTNLSKLLRSIRTKNSYQSSLEVNYTLNKYETLESVQRNKISLTNFDDDWINIAMRNDLSEEDYDTEGGKQITLPSGFSSLFLQSVVDNLIDDKLYGLDFNRKITFKDEDIEVLDYKQTALQSLEILISITKGSVPESPLSGISEDLVVGTNRSQLSLPILQRQLKGLFSTDDTFMDFQINSIDIESDALFMSFSVNTVRGELLENIISVQQ